MGFNELLADCGEFGYFQKLLAFGFLMPAVISVSCTYWTQIFILLIPPHRCKLYPDDNDYLNAANLSLTSKDECHLYQNRDLKPSEIVPCPYGIVYDYSLYFPTFASEHDWVCENSWKMYLVHTCYWIGVVLGSFSLGFLSDKYGRKRAYQVAVMLTLIFDVATFFAQEQIIFVVVRFASAFFGRNLATMSFVLAVEYTGPNKRRLNTFMWSFPYAVICTALPWIAYYLHHWKYLLIISWIPMIITVITSFFLTESASWLITQGRLEEAAQCVHRMARINGKNMDRDYIIEKLKEEQNQCKEVKSQGNSKPSTNTGENRCSSKTDGGETGNLEKKDEIPLFNIILQLMRSPNLRKKLIFFSVIWFIACMCYNGNNLESSNLPFNMYIVYSVGGLTEMLGIFFCLFTIDKFGRRWTNAGCFILGGVLGIISTSIDTKEVIIVLALVIRSCYSAAFDITFTFTNESFPTIIRGRAISFVRTFGGLGSTVSPFVVRLSEKEALLPLVVFGMLAVASGVLTIFLPETAKQHLPHEMEDGENFGKTQPFWFCPFSEKPLEEEMEYQRKTHFCISDISEDGKDNNTQVKCISLKKLEK
ncbi:Organic cation transporter 1, partial [Stegodyphus mimosarum]